MSLIAKIKSDLLELRKASEKDKLAISEINTLFSDAQRIGFDNGKRETTDEEVLSVIRKTLKGIDECLKYVPNDETYLRKKAIVEQYLPKQMTREELHTAVHVFSTGYGNLSKADIMKYLKSAFTGKYDGKLASSVVDEYLGN